MDGINVGRAGREEELSTYRRLFVKQYGFPPSDAQLRIFLTENRMQARYVRTNPNSEQEKLKFLKEREKRQLKEHELEYKQHATRTKLATRRENRLEQELGVKRARLQARMQRRIADYPVPTTNLLVGEKVIGAMRESPKTLAPLHPQAIMAKWSKRREAQKEYKKQLGELGGAIQVRISKRSKPTYLVQATPAAQAARENYRSKFILKEGSEFKRYPPLPEPIEQRGGADYVTSRPVGYIGSTRARKTSMESGIGKQLYHPTTPRTPSGSVWHPLNREAISPYSTQQHITSRPTLGTSLTTPTIHREGLVGKLKNIISPSHPPLHQDNKPHGVSILGTLKKASEK